MKSKSHLCFVELFPGHTVCTVMHPTAPCVPPGFPEAASLYLAAFNRLIFLESIQFILLTHLTLSPQYPGTLSSMALVYVAYLLDCFDLAIMLYFKNMGGIGVHLEKHLGRQDLKVI